MDDILDDVQFEKFFEDLKDFKSRSATRKTLWENPTGKMIVALEFWIDIGLAAAAKWREENPEQVLANLDKARAASAKWKEENPEEIAAHFEETKASMLIGGAKWRGENPEKVIAQFQEARAALAKWRKEHPEESRSSAMHGLAALAKWRREHPEEIRSSRRKGVASMLIGGAKWRGENPEKVIANAENARAGLAKWFEENRDAQLARLTRGLETFRHNNLQTYLERLRLIKPLISETGLRVSEIHKLCPQWTRGQLATFLKKAVKQRDLVLIRNNYHDCRYTTFQ